MSRGVTRVCWPCIEVEAWEMYAIGYKPRIRKDWLSAKGAPMRMCTNCKEGKPRTRRYFSPLAQGEGLARTCRKCRIRISAQARKRRREREGPSVRAREAKRARERRKLPHVKERERKARARWRAKMRATPEGRERLAEIERMSYRLRRDRLGKPPPPVAEEPPASRQVERLPSAPLAALIDRLIGERKAVAEMLDEPTRGVVGQVCEDLGVAERTWRRWRDGTYPRVRIGVAERILLNAEVEWFEVYSYDDHAAAFLAVEVES